MTKPLPKEERVLTFLSLRGVPRSLRNAFKSWCVLRGLTMQEKVISMMRNCIAKDSKPSTTEKNTE